MLRSVIMNYWNERQTKTLKSQEKMAQHVQGKNNLNDFIFNQKLQKEAAWHFQLLKEKNC